MSQPHPTRKRARSALHWFAGDWWTIAEIREMVPILSEEMVRKYLRAGHRTVVAMMSVDSADAFRRAGQASRQAARKRMFGLGSRNGWLRGSGVQE